MDDQGWLTTSGSTTMLGHSVGNVIMIQYAVGLRGKRIMTPPEECEKLLCWRGCRFLEMNRSTHMSFCFSFYIGETINTESQCDE